MTPAPAGAYPRAAVIVVGTELVAGVRVDTNGAEVAGALAAAGYIATRREILPDEVEILAERIAALVDSHELVVVTGGLGPTHDDVTRQAAAAALGLPLGTDSVIEARLQPVLARHRIPDAAAQVLRQAHVLEGARILMPERGTAPGQLVPTAHGHLVLLPGPPHELRPMLAEALRSLGRGARAEPRVIGCVGIAESDAQLTAQKVLAPHPGIGLTVLARPALVDIVLIDEGVTSDELDLAAREIAEAIGDACYSTSGAMLAQAVIERASSRRVTLSLAESCTGGLIAAALTSVPGASSVFLGSVVTYADDMKRELLGVQEETLRDRGAVSGETAREMASGVRELTGADVALAVTGIAGPAGGSTAKPVGTVWFAVASGTDVTSERCHFSGDREIVRARATATALDLLRRALPPPETGPA
ncbi:MAG: nicotinamide-nucleotide amidohydrolase family protein [Anaerosomatales bacterium]|nr:nicotinamide-nucleotide amidohydrolase family protein [Anaerosomatales bacterium]MDT8433361.1 nicotinamide-nucleotide amidohydrolase family protein [Anaerosomatales bacterium]